MNLDYIKAKANLLRGSTPQEREQLMASIGVCAGLLPAQQSHVQLTTQKRQEIQSWLEKNVIRLRLHRQLHKF